MVQHLHKTDGCEGWLFGRRSARSSSVLSATLLSAILAIGLPTAGARAQAVQFDERSIIFETNFTDCDVGVQIFFDGEGWKRVNLRDPNYQVILLVAAKLGLNRQGLTEGFFESEEPVIEELADLPGSDCDEPEDNFDDLLARFPEGRYVFVG